MSCLVGTYVAAHAQIYNEISAIGRALEMMAVVTSGGNHHEIISMVP